MIEGGVVGSAINCPSANDGSDNADGTDDAKYYVVGKGYNSNEDANANTDKNILVYHDYYGYFSLLNGMCTIATS